MVDFNLLPWREQKLLYQQRLLIKIFLIAILLIVLLWISLRIFLLKEINFLDQQNEKLKIVEPNVTVDELDKTDRLIQDYFKSNQAILKIIHRAPMAGVCFNELRVENQLLFFSGTAFSPAALTHFLETWELADLFDQIHIEAIQPINKDRFRFQFTSNFKSI